MKIGELAKSAGKTVRALHLYEEMELLTPAERSPGGFRLYDQRNVARIELIDKLQRLGLSLPDIKRMLKDWGGCETAPRAMAQLEAFYRARLEDTRASIRELQTLEGELVASLQYLDGCHRCETRAAPVEGCGNCDRTATECRDLTLIAGVPSH